MKKTILIVDDDPDFTKMVSLAVSSALREQGYAIITANNGRTAIEKVKSESPEVILLDLNLPDIDGKEILKKIKQIDEDIPTIVITGHGGERVAIELMKAGAMDFISKPFEIEVLLQAINDAVKVRNSQTENEFSGGGVSLEQFFPFLAHEVRNPLHAISGALTVIQRRINLSDEILSRAVKIINEEVRHLTGFVQDCLDFAGRPMSGHFVEAQINEIVSGTMGVISHMFDELFPKITITYRLDPELPRVRINYHEIKEVFVNIAKNSFESMREGGELTIETGVKSQPEGDFITVVFSDQGAGVRKEDMKNLFSPFFTTKVRGSGLGLAICRRIIEGHHHGRIDIESEERIGTRVTVKIPCLYEEKRP